MTANAMKGDRELCLDSGMDGYVSKPVNLMELRRQINAVLRQPVAVRETEAVRDTERDLSSTTSTP